MKITKTGFSLIELIVVISIIAILAALAVPSYQKYRAKALIVEALQTAEPLFQDFKKAANTMPTAQGYGSAYSSNNFWPPNQFMINGNLQTVYTTVAVPWTPISHIGYGTSRSGNSGDGNGGGFTLRITNTSGYQTSTYPYFEVQVVYRWVGNQLVMACGSGIDAWGVFPVPPAELLPSNCQCRNTNWWAAVGDPNNNFGCPPAF